MPVLQYTAFVIETRDAGKLASSKAMLTGTAEQLGLSEETVFQFVWHPSAPHLTVLTIFENGRLSGDGFEFWGAECGRALAKELRVRTWELHLCGGTVFNQSVIALGSNGRARWDSSFDGSLPTAAALKQNDPFVPLAESREAVREALRELGAGRLEADAGLQLDVVIDVEQGEPLSGSKAIQLRAKDDWKKALAKWNAKRPKSAPRLKEPKKRAKTEPPRPFEVVFVWKKADAKRLAAAQLFVHDVVRVEGGDPGEFTATLHERGALKLLRCTPSPQLANSRAWSWFSERISLLGPLADAVMCIELDAGFPTSGRLGSIEGRFPLFAMKTRVFMQQAVGVGVEQLFELNATPELIEAFFAAGRTLEVRDKPFGLAEWNALRRHPEPKRTALTRKLTQNEDATFAQFEQAILNATAELRCALPQKNSASLSGLEARLGKQLVTGTRKQWAKEVRERAEAGPMMSVLFG